MKKTLKLFGGFGNSYYLCNRKRVQPAGYYEKQIIQIFKT